jgi:biopolymer transport protein ExbD
MPHPCLRWLGALAASAALAGCYMPGAQRHAELRVAADGSYRFNGQAVAAPDLAAAITAAKQAGSDLVVQIQPSSSADLAAVRRAVEAIKSAKARVAFAADAS